MAAFKGRVRDPRFSGDRKDTEYGYDPLDRQDGVPVCGDRPHHQMCIRDSMDVAVKPHGLPKVKLRADVLDGGEDLVRPRIVFIAADHGIRKHPVIFENFCP